MATTITLSSHNQLQAHQAIQPLWQRISLLILLGYEAAGCLSGGFLLISEPDGRYMQMPVELMNGVFSSFLIPGIILSGLGILNTLAFISVIRKKTSDWFMTGLAMGGLTIWFIAEIIILQELHWLHLMWGLPVLMGWVFIVPLIALRNNTSALQKGLLICGIASSLWYVAINIIVPALDEHYVIMSTTVSELSAIGAPTRITWVLLAIFYPLLFMAFGWGVIRTAGNDRRLKLAGSLIIAYSILNFYWPPMHQREVIGAGGGTFTDTLHIAWAMITVAFMLALMTIGAAAMKKRFRYMTAVLIAVLLVFGLLTGSESPGIEANTPTPYIGLWERINIAAFMFWIILFAGALLRKQQ